MSQTYQHILQAASDSAVKAQDAARDACDIAPAVDAIILTECIGEARKLADKLAALLEAHRADERAKRERGE